MGILLEALPGFTWWGGIGVSIIMGVFAFYFKRDQDSQKARVDKIEARVEKLELADRATNDRIHSVKETVLKEINGIALSIEKFRYENSSRP